MKNAYIQTEVEEAFHDSVFWLCRRLESFFEAVEDAMASLDPDIWRRHELQQEYEALGCPLGKSKRGLKKWIKRTPYGILEVKSIR